MIEKLPCEVHEWKVPVPKEEGILIGYCKRCYAKRKFRIYSYIENEYIVEGLEIIDDQAETDESG